MTTAYTHILDLAKEAEPPADGILSRTVFQDERIKAVVFGFGQGQELSEHTAAKPAMLYFVKGEASVGLGERRERGSGRRLGPHVRQPEALDQGKDAGGHAPDASEVTAAAALTWPGQPLD